MPHVPNIRDHFHLYVYVYVYTHTYGTYVRKNQLLLRAILYYVMVTRPKKTCYSHFPHLF